MRPGIFHDSPLVVVTPQMSPSGETPSQLIVPQKECAGMRPSRTMPSPASIHAFERRRCCSGVSPAPAIVRASPAARASPPERPRPISSGSVTSSIP